MNLKNLLFAFFTLTFLQANAQSSSIQWINTIPYTPPNYKGFSLIEVDNNNLYMAGSYEGGSITIGNQTLTSQEKALYMTKLNNEGSVIWAKNIANGECDIAGFATDKLGNFYIYGYYMWEITIGNITFNSPTSSMNMFLAKLDADGNIIWVKKAEGNCNGCSIYTRDIIIDSNNDIIITGNFQGNEISFGNNSLSKVGDRDGFIAKYNQNGNDVWAKILKGEVFDDRASLAIDLNGYIYIGGSFVSNLFLIGDISLQNNGISNIYFAKLNSDGNVLWAKSYGGSGMDSAQYLYSDTLGNVVMLGYYEKSFSIDNTQINEIGHSDIFITKFTNDGSAIWSKTIGGQELGESGLNLSIDSSNNIYASGYFYSPSITIADTTIQNLGSANSFLTKIDSDGNFKATLGINSTDYATGSIYIYPSGNIYLAGGFDSNLTFNNQTFTTETSAMYFAKLSNDILSTSNFENKSYTVYPNPCKEKIHLPYNIKELSINYTIIDTTGRIVKNGITHNNSINVESLPKGLYILNIANKTGIKFIKE